MSCEVGSKNKLVLRSGDEGNVRHILDDNQIFCFHTRYVLPNCGGDELMTQFYRQVVTWSRLCRKMEELGWEGENGCRQI